MSDVALLGHRINALLQSDWLLHTILELIQGFRLVTPDPFSRELGGFWARDYEWAGIRNVVS